MSGLMDKVKNMVGGDSSESSRKLGDDALPGNIVEASGGTYDAGPGVKGSSNQASMSNSSSNRKDNPTADERDDSAQGSSYDKPSATDPSSSISGGDTFANDPTTSSGAQTSDYSSGAQTTDYSSGAQTSGYSSGAGYSSIGGGGEIQQGRADISKFTTSTVGDSDAALESIRQHGTTGYGSGPPTDQIEGYGEGSASTIRGALRGDSTTTGAEYGGDGVGATGGSGYTQDSSYGSSGQGLSSSSGSAGYDDTSSSRAQDTTSSSAGYDDNSASSETTGYGHKSALDRGSGANATGPARDSTTTDNY